MMPPAGLMQAFHDKAVIHLAVDLNRYYCDPALSPPVRRAPYFYGRSQRLARRIDDFADMLAKKVPTYWIIHDRGESLRQMMQWLRPLASERDKEELNVAIEKSKELSGRARPDAKIIAKTGFDGFDRTLLDENLHQAGAKVVLLTGVFKDCCVLQTALSAREKKYHACIVDDLTLWSPEANRVTNQKGDPVCNWKGHTRTQMQKHDVATLRSRQVLEMLAS